MTYYTIYNYAFIPNPYLPSPPGTPPPAVLFRPASGGQIVAVRQPGQPPLGGRGALPSGIAAAHRLLRLGRAGRLLGKGQLILYVYTLCFVSL